MDDIFASLALLNHKINGSITSVTFYADKSGIIKNDVTVHEEHFDSIEELRRLLDKELLKLLTESCQKS